MAEISWGTSELIHYRNADGLPLQAILYKPDHFDPKKKYPMLVYLYERLTQNVHNFIEPRPTNVDQPELLREQWLSCSGAGYRLQNWLSGRQRFRVRAAWRFRKLWTAALWMRTPSEFRDIAGARYQIAYMVTQTTRFRAAAPGAPVADMISAYDGIRWGPGIPRQFQYEHTQSRIGGTLWQYPMRYVENSPIFMADRIKTPLVDDSQRRGRCRSVVSGH